MVCAPTAGGVKTGADDEAGHGPSIGQILEDGGIDV